MIVNFNNFKREYSSIKKEADNSIKRVTESGWYILGKEVENFENNFAKYIGSKHAIGVANGMDALQISLMALGMGKGDEVITTSLSAGATGLAITAVGAKPIFVDIDDFYHLDAGKIENKINKKTKAIIPVHLYGQSVDLDKIIRIARKHRLHIVEDCAQSHGATYKNKKTGDFGALGCFSFYPTKNLGAMGDAGAIVTNNKDLAEKCRVLRNYGYRNRYEHSIKGINSRLDEIQAAILSIKLKHLDKQNTRRQEIAKIYTRELSSIKGLQLPLTRKNSGHVYHLFVVEAENRDGLQKFLKDRGIDTLIHYPIPLHKQECFKEYGKTSLQQVEQKVKNILSLPINPFLTIKEVLYVCKCIKEFYID